jgi:hypothetical protein
MGRIHEIHRSGASASLVSRGLQAFFSTVVKLPLEAPQVVPMPYDTLVNHDGQASTFDV